MFSVRSDLKDTLRPVRVDSNMRKEASHAQHFLAAPTPDAFQAATAAAI